MPDYKGILGVLNKHMNIVVELKPGILEIVNKNQVSEKILMTDGFTKISPEKCMLVVEDSHIGKY